MRTSSASSASSPRSTRSPRSVVEQALDAGAGWPADAGYAVEEIGLELFAEAYRLWYLLCIEDNRRDLPIITELGGEGAASSLQTQFAVGVGYERTATPPARSPSRAP